MVKHNFGDISVFNSKQIKLDLRLLTYAVIRNVQ